MIIALSGTPAAGKDTVADYLAKKGFKLISPSEILRSILKERNLEANLENLTEAGNKIGTGLVERGLVGQPADANIIFTSIRQPEEIELLRKQKDCFVVFVDADPRIRFERLKSRGRAGDSKTFDQFMDIEYKQSDGKSGGMNLGACKQMADYVIENNGTMEEFNRRIEQVYKAMQERIAKNG